MSTITLNVSDNLAERLSRVGDRLPDLLSFALDMAGIPGAEEMTAARTSPAWMETIDFLASSPTHQEIIEFKLSPAAQAHLEVLLQGHHEGELTPQEQAELHT